MTYELEQPFLIWAWVSANPMENIGGLAGVGVFLFWLASKNHRAFKRLKKFALYELALPCTVAAVFFVVDLGIDLKLITNGAATEYDIVAGRPVWKLSEFDVERLLSAYANLQWIAFIAAVYALLFLLFIVTEQVYFGEDNTDEK